MPRRLVSDLADREQLAQPFLVSDKQLRANRNGNLYLHLRLADRSGAISAMLWNASEKLARTFDAGDYVQVEGATQIYNGALQIIASRVERADDSQINEQDFFPLGPSDVDRLAVRLAEMLRGLHSDPLRELAECFLADEALMAKFNAAPAGIKNHHAYRGGLLEHVVDLMELTQIVAPRYAEVDGELLLIGAFLHDIGKVDELSYDRQLAYGDEGQLIGHLVIGIGILDAKLRQYEEQTGAAFPGDLAMRLRHMVVSHHGEYEFGSPKLPMTLEAVMLHQLDTLDARIRSLSQLIREDPDPENDWTPYQSSIGRKIYKPSLKS